MISGLQRAPSNLILNPSFLTYANWTCTAGWSDNTATILTDPTKSGLWTGATEGGGLCSGKWCGTGWLVFAYKELSAVRVAQSVVLHQSSSSYTFSVDVGQSWRSGSVLDPFAAQASFYAASTLLETIGTGASFASGTAFKTYSFNTTEDMTNATRVEIVLQGSDGKNWAGTYGPKMTNVSLMAAFDDQLSGGPCVSCPAGTYSTVRGADTVRTCLSFGRGKFSSSKGALLLDGNCNES